MKLPDVFRYIDANYEQLIGHERALMAQAIVKSMRDNFDLGPAESDLEYVFAMAKTMGGFFLHRILHAYLGDKRAISGENILAQSLISSFDATAIGKKNTSPQTHPSQLLKQADQALAECSFVDFDYVNHGNNALIIKGVKKDGAISALRFTAHHMDRAASIAVLPAEQDPIRLPYAQQIEILPFANEIAPRPEEKDYIPRSRSWSQHLLYLLALLHAEGKFAWQYMGDIVDVNDVRAEKIVRYNGQMWISDSGGIRPSRRARQDAVDAARFILQDKITALPTPNETGLMCSEYFTAHVGPKKTAPSLKAWAKERRFHIMEVPTQKNGEVLSVIVDPARLARGPEIARCFSESYTFHTLKGRRDELRR
jgi:hypothetical protein